jgi:WXG100 family type VII secretion target
MADITQVDYDVLAQMEKVWQQGADAVGQSLSELRQMAEALHGEGWQGQAADKFFEEFSGDVLPALERYSNGMRFAAEIMGKIRQTFNDAEEESKGYFSGV